MEANVEEKTIQKKLKKFDKIYPWFNGLSADLLFYIAIDTLFLTIVKGLTSAQVSFLIVISTTFNILMQIPILRIIKRIGNTKSVRLGTFLLLCSALLITFATDYFVIIIGKIIYEMAFVFKKMDGISLKNNLTYEKRPEDYLKMQNKANTIYAAITLIIAVIAGNLFNANNYLPMYLCIAVCIINCILSFYIFDVREIDKKIITEENKEKGKSKEKMTKIIFVIIVTYTLFFGLIANGQGNSKLLIQYELNECFTVELTAIYLSLIVATSRISRLLANLLFNKIYDKLKDKINILIAIMISLAFVFVILGYFINTNLLVKFVFMAIGFNIILAVRDPFKIYMQDLVLKNSKLSEQQACLTYLELGRKIGTAVVSVLITAMLTKLSLIYVILLLFVLSFAQIGITKKLFKLVKQDE